MGEHYDFYIQNLTLLLANVFESFQNMCPKIYELDPAHFLAEPISTWQSVIKKTKVKLHLVIDIDMLFMVEKGIRGERWHVFINMWELILKTWIIFDKNKQSIKYWDMSNL